MDPRISLWNILHDGEITVVALEGDTLVMFVNIPHLRERISPLGDSIVVRLLGFRSLGVQDLDGTTTSTDLAEVSQSGITILETGSDSMPVKISTTSGSLTLDFDALELQLDTGRKLELAELEQTSADFWAEFEARAQALRTDA